jgi:hypothetical protein
MSQTKVTDALRDVTAVDGTKIDAVDGAKITTGTIPEARITSLDATKLTGNIANARIPASAVTQHVTDYNDASIRADILKLALHQAIDGNRAAYNLEDSFVDGFEDDTGITTKTSVRRHSADEYVNASAFGTPAYVTGDRRSRITATTNHSLDQGNITYLVDGAITSNFNGSDSILISVGDAAVNKYFQFDFGSGNSILITEAKWYRNNASHHGQYRWQGSNDASAWTTIGSDFQLGGATPTTTLTAMSGNSSGYRYYRVLGVSGTITGNNWDQQIEFKETGLVVTATGTLISDPQTASTSRTSASGVIIYEDAVGTNTLGTDLKIYFTANNGTNWTEAASYGTATTYSGTKKLVKLGATTVSAGSAIAVKAVWANQSSSSGTTKTVTAIDGAHHDNVQAKIGSTSIFCDGTNDAIEVADSADFAFAGDYTVEFWVYFNGAPANNAHICGQGGNSASNFAFFCRSEGSGTFLFGTSNGSTQRLINPGMDLSNAWHHVALVKYGTSQKLYIDGTSRGTSLTHSEPVQNVSAPWEFSGGNNSASHMSAWWDEIRFSNVARYTGNFTAFGQNGGTVASPTAFTTDANTVLLIHGDGSNGSTTMTDTSAIAGKEARLHGWAVNY